MEYIYFDNAATTRPCAEVDGEILRAHREFFYNSAALYAPSVRVKQEIEKACEKIKQRLEKMGQGNLIITSGATEGNNMAIFGKIKNKTQHLLVLGGEHSSVYSPSKFLKDSGYDVDYIPLDREGGADLGALGKLLKPNTAMVVFGLVNSDTGHFQDAKNIVHTVRTGVSPGAHIHCDATQAFAKFNFDAGVLGFDSCTISAHKIRGPKGIGALWIRKGVNLHPIMYGGGQQMLRPGTEDTPGILGFARAVEMFDTDANFLHVKRLHARLIQGLPKNCTVNGRNDNPYITNIQLPSGVLGSTVMNALGADRICVGLGSACASTAAKNRTLLAMGIAEAKTKQVLRISFGVENTPEEVEVFLHRLGEILKRF